ncbi:hypothetical protein bcere0023_1670 [Bacillus cereus Rock4-2]|nr:hypothetical protein bcere0023_1670 [Bacillus cereus Rock4-2]
MFAWADVDKRREKRNGIHIEERIRGNFYLILKMSVFMKL